MLVEDFTLDVVDEAAPQLKGFENERMRHDICRSGGVADLSISRCGSSNVIRGDLGYMCEIVTVRP